MLRLIFCIFCFLASSLSSEAAIFFHLDNQTPAEYEEIIQDPFLVLRTKVNDKESKMDVVESWRKFAHLTPSQCVQCSKESHRFDGEYFSKSTLSIKNKKSRR